jgi:hypothetical protein
MSPTIGDDVELKESALTYTHFGTWADTGVSGGPEVVDGAYAVRKDNTLWVMAVKADGFTPTNVYRRIWTGGAWQASEILSDATHFTNMKANGQAIALHAYLGSGTSTDRNTVYAYVGTESAPLVHYGQVKSTVTAAPYTFSQNTRSGPADFMTYHANFTRALRPALATSGTCTIGGTTGTCLYLFIEDDLGFIYYKWVACPTDGNCSAFSTTTTVQSGGTPNPALWNRIESAGYVDGGLAAAQVSSGKIAVIGVTFSGSIVSWNLTASTGAIVSSFSWPSPTGTFGGLNPSQTIGATTYNRGSGCAQILATGLGAHGFHPWSTATCDGSSLATPWQDLGAPPAGGGYGVNMIAETTPGSPPHFDLGITNGGSIYRATDW